MATMDAATAAICYRRRSSGILCVEWIVIVNSGSGWARWGGGVVGGVGGVGGGGGGGGGGEGVKLFDFDFDWRQ